MILLGREVTEPIELVTGLPLDHDHAKTHPQCVAQLRDILELAHQIAREVLGRSVEHAKKQYGKNVARTHYNVSDTVCT
jgi:hypothetical protein